LIALLPSHSSVVVIIQEVLLLEACYTLSVTF